MVWIQAIGEYSTMVYRALVKCSMTSDELFLTEYPTSELIL